MVLFCEEDEAKVVNGDCVLYNILGEASGTGINEKEER